MGQADILTYVSNDQNNKVTSKSGWNEAFCMCARLSLCDRVSLQIWGNLKIEAAFLRNKGSQLRCFRQLIRVSPGWLSSKLSQARGIWQRTWAGPRHAK